MKKQQILTRTLAVIVVIASVIPLMITSAAQKVSACCEKVSRNIVNDSIISYTLQNQDLPCIKAVIFKTEEKTHCVFWREKWAWKEICNFKTNGGSDCVKPLSWAKKKFPKFFDKKN